MLGVVKEGYIAMDRPEGRFDRCLLGFRTKRVAPENWRWQSGGLGGTGGDGAMLAPATSAGGGLAGVASAAGMRGWLGWSRSGRDWMVRLAWGEQLGRAGCGRGRGMAHVERVEAGAGVSPGSAPVA